MCIFLSVTEEDREKEIRKSRLKLRFLCTRGFGGGRREEEMPGGKGKRQTRGRIEKERVGKGVGRGLQGTLN